MGGIPGGQYINRIIDGSLRVEVLFEEGRGLFRKGGQGQPVTDHDVGSNDRRSAGVGDHTDPVALGDWLGGKGSGRLDQFTLIPERQDAGFFENQVRGQVLFGQAARMGGCGLGTFSGAAGFHGQDGLLGGHFTRHCHEGFGIAQTFHVSHNHAGALVFAEVADNFRDGDIAGIPIGGVDAGSNAHL